MCIIFRNKKPVSYASICLTESEKRFAQIEKEMLGIFFAVQKFHNYIYGLKDLTIRTDHKPLLTILRKNLNKVSSSLQRMRLKLMRYDLSLKYIIGKHLRIIYLLSRPFFKDKIKENKDFKKRLIP